MERIKVISDYLVSELTEDELAVFDVVAEMPMEDIKYYFDHTTSDNPQLYRILRMNIIKGDYSDLTSYGLVHARIQHGWGYALEDDIYRSLIIDEEDEE